MRGDRAGVAAGGGPDPPPLGSRGAASPRGAPGSPHQALPRPRPHARLSAAQAWLRLYGYLPQPSRQMSTMRSAQTLSSALAEMQKFYGITVTGILDEETKA